MENQKSNRMAVAGFVLALITVLIIVFFGTLEWLQVLGSIMWVLGLIFSSVGLAKANKPEGKGKGMAVAGLVISIAIPVIILLIFYAIINAFGTPSA
ncbi:MAG: hypothetical protein GDA42_08450 [Ekhidna sp.]|nr:hypothetical protein [Ekhidna sp.]MBC6410471.1 hypothetical protein [Ekhidna sp.]